MVFTKRNTVAGLTFVSMLAVAVGYYQHTQRIAFLKADPRRYYGKLRLEPPIRHSGFGYYLDGGTITTTLKDSNGVELPLCFSPPGEFFGDTEVFIGTREQMWSDYHARNETYRPTEDGYRFQATRIPRGSDSSNLIAEYVSSAVRTIEMEYEKMEPQNDWDRWHIVEFARHNKVFGDRIDHILTSKTPVDDRWGYGEPHAPMPDPPE